MLHRLRGNNSQSFERIHQSGKCVVRIDDRKRLLIGFRILRYPAREHVAQAQDRQYTWRRIRFRGRNGCPGNRLELFNAIRRINGKIALTFEPDRVLHSLAYPLCFFTRLCSDFGDHILKRDIRADGHRQDHLCSAWRLVDGCFQSIEINAGHKAVFIGPDG